MNPDEPRPRIITPRTRGYVHRFIIVVRDTVAIDEFGEVIEHPEEFAAANEGHIWIVDDPAWILNIMVAAHGDHPDFNYQIVTSEDDAPVRVVKSRVTRFGFRCKHEKTDPARAACPYRRRRAMHSVWSPADLSPNPGKLVGDYSHGSLLTLATDIRDWCKQEGIPLPSTLAGIANSLLRDPRFWPDPRGRVPRATNENIRKYLPGVYSELRAPKWETNRNAVSLDQRTAYHVAAQEVPTPDPTSLFARGYFNCPTQSPIWAFPGTELYDRTIRQPGIIYVHVDVTHLRKHHVRPPAVKNPGEYRCALWTNEVPLCEANGVTIKGITAAWTATRPDEGLPRYGAFAARQITEASEFRKRWLKPTLHALYGLLATRPRRVKIGHLRGTARLQTVARIGFGHEFPVHQADLGVIQPPTANVAALGTLQAEIRKRSLQLARDLMEAGAEVLHIHADGLHISGHEMPLIPDGWKVAPLTHLQYLDEQSWTADEGDCLPGRDTDARHRLEEARHHARLGRIHREGGHLNPDFIPTTPERWSTVTPTYIGPATEHGCFYSSDDMEYTDPLYWADGGKRHYVTYQETPNRAPHHHGKRNLRSRLASRLQRTQADSAVYPGPEDHGSRPRPD